MIRWCHSPASDLPWVKGLNMSSVLERLRADKTTNSHTLMSESVCLKGETGRVEHRNTNTGILGRVQGVTNELSAKSVEACLETNNQNKGDDKVWLYI